MRNDSRGIVRSHIFTDYLTHDFEMFWENLILPKKYEATAIPAESCYLLTALQIYKT